MTATVTPSAAPDSIAVLGAGVMGPGIAVTFARAGGRVSLTARRATSLERAKQRVDEILRLMASRQLVTRESATQLRKLITMRPFDELDLEVDLILESIPEDSERKKEVLASAESRARPETLIVTNTSSLSLSELSDALNRPERFAGYHWFNPPELMALVEVIPGPRTQQETVNILVSWTTAIGKEPVLISREIEGFVANRLQYALMREGYALVDQGVCTLEDVDQVMKSCLGPRWASVGPYEAMDLAGLDVHLAVARRLFPLLANDSAPPQQLEQLVSEGALGAKSGRGLRGTYDLAAIQELGERRVAALLALASAGQRSLV